MDRPTNLTTDTDQPSEILETSSARGSANGSPAGDEKGKDHAPSGVPALPADGIGITRDPFTFSRPVSAPVSPADDTWPLSGIGTSQRDTAPLPAENEPVPAELAESAVAETGTGWPAGSTSLDTGASTAPADPPAAQPSGSPETPTVSAAAFAWDPPAPTPSPARNFLRSSASTSPPPRTPAVSVTPPRAQARPGGAPVPGARPRPNAPAKRSARQAHLTIARVEPWSVMKFSFVVSLVAFVILFVAVSVIYSTLSALGVFTSLQHVVQSVTSSQNSSGVNAATWFTASRVLSYTALLGAINIVLITAMSTIGAVVYNLTSRLIGGVEVTLRETE